MNNPGQAINREQIMKKTLLVTICLFLSSTAFSENAAVREGEIEVTITGFESDAGLAKLALFDSAAGFPSKAENGVRRMETGISNRVAKFVLKNVPYGHYAISVYHDENANGKLDRNFLGIPSEGFGASNDATGLFGPPKFEEAMFELASKKKTLTIKIQ
jgi:uncharacterized protein (DUF2141 family)